MHTTVTGALMGHIIILVRFYFGNFRGAPSCRLFAFIVYCLYMMGGRGTANLMSLGLAIALGWWWMHPL